jgi:filamentous hemagglutinin family protein
MNRSYRLVWSQSTQTYQAVAETAKGRGKAPGLRAIRRQWAWVFSGVVSSVALNTGLGGLSYAQQAPPTAANASVAPVAVALIPSPKQLPMLSAVTQGQVNLSQTQNTNQAVLSVIQNSDKAVINWNEFNLGVNASVNFIQPNSSSVILNRVIDSKPSQIYGAITSNGQVFLSNPNGVYFSPSAQVDVGGLVATTHGISDQDFLNGHIQLDRNGSVASVINDGNLNAKLNGYIALLAPEVRNNGVVVAQMGSVVLASGEAITLQFSQNSLAGVTTTAATIATLIENKQAIRADGGQIILSALAVNKLQAGVINNTGLIEASSMVSKGGKIYLEGDHISLASTSVIRANGALGGGDVSIGVAALANAPERAATTVNMQEGSSIQANATQSGSGGSVMVSNNLLNLNATSTLAGDIEAKGGPQGGDGGHVETSGSQLQLGPLKVDTGSSKGMAGSWLLDPYDYTIDLSAASAINSALNSGNVTISTANNVSGYGSGGNGASTGNIIVNSALSWASNSTLTLQASGNVYINASIVGSGSGAGVNVYYGGSSLTQAPTNGTFYQFNLNNPGTSYISLPNASASLNIANQHYTLIESMSQLQAMSPTGVYALGKSLQIPGLYTNSVYGNTFTGIFDGLGNTISGIQLINSCVNTCNIGFFGQVTSGAQINNLQLNETFTLTGTGATQAFSDYSVGGLVGKVYGGSSAQPNSFMGDGVSFVVNTNNASHISINGFWGGGLFGKAYGTSAAPVYANINQSFASLNLDNTGASSITASSVGGIIGDASASTNAAASGSGAVRISNTYTSGSINVKQSGYWGVGGLIGQAYGPTVNASNSFTYFQAGSMVSTSGSISVGGLFGWTTSLTISNSYTTYPGTNNPGSGLYYGVSLTGNTTLPSGLSSSAWKISNGTIILNNLPLPGPAPAAPLYVQETVNAGNYGNLTFAYTLVDAGGNAVTLGSGAFANVTSVAGTPTYNINNSSNAGFYSIYYTSGLSLSGSDASKYTLTAYPSAYTINPISLYVLPTANQSSVYGVTPVINYQLNSNSTGSGTAYSLASVNATGTASFSNAPTSTSAVGTYAITYDKGMSSPNYVFNPAASSVNFVVNPATLTITGATTNSTYTAASQTNTFSTTGLVNGDKVVSVSGLATGQTVSTTPIPDALSNAVGVGLSNYSIQYVNGSLNITPAPLIVTGSNTSVRYNATAQTNTFTISGLLGADSVSSVTGQAIRTDAGSTADQLSINSGTNLSNYQITYRNGSLTVLPAKLTVTADDKSSFVGQGLQSLTYSVSGLLGTDSIASASLSSNANNATAQVSAISVSAAQAGPSTNLSNYAITYVPGQYTVAATGLLIDTSGGVGTYASLPTITPNSVSYLASASSAPYNLTLASSAAGVYTYTDSTAGSALGSGVSFSIVPNTSLSTGSGNLPVGSYGLKVSNFTVNGSSTGLPTALVKGNLIVNPQAATVTAVAASRPYNGSIQTQTYSFSGNSLDILNFTGLASGTNAGSYVSNLSLNALTSTDAANYTLSYVNNAFTISPLALSVSGSKTYDGSTRVNYTGMTVSGNLPGEAVTVISGSGTTLSANANTYNNSALSGLAIAVGGSGNASNYTLPSTGTLTINPAPLVITGSKSYNGTTSFGNNNLSVSGAQNGEVVTLTTGTATSSSSNAGTYANSTLSGVGVSVSSGNALASNYALPSSATLTITPALLGVSATKTFDASVSTDYTAMTATGAQNGESIAFTSGTATSLFANVGTYNNSALSGLGISVSGGNALASNYSLPSAGTVTISKAVLSITGSMSYSASNSFGYANMTLGGVQGNDTIFLTAGSATTSSANAGTYAATALSSLAISAAGGALVSNYSLPSFGTMVISPLALSVTASKTYDGNANIALGSMSVSGALSGQTITLTGGSGVAASANVGTGIATTLSGMSFTASGTGALASNYSLPSTASTNITAGSLYVIANPGQSSVYGRAPAITYTFNTNSTGTGTTVPAASINLLSGTAAFSVSATTAVGSYNNLTFSTGLTSQNYNFYSGSPTTYTVTSAPLTIVGTKSYDGTGAFTYSNLSVQGVQNAQTVTLTAGTVSNTPSGNVGSYSSINLSNLSLSVVGGAASNYTLPSTGTMTITAAPLTVAGSKVYNASTAIGYANMQVTGAQNGEILTLTAGSANTTSANVGTYASTALSGLALTVSAGNASASNYTLPTTGTITISQASLYVIPNAGQSSVYGSAPVVNYSFNTNANGSGSVVSAATSGVSGTAVVTGSPTATSSAGNNYLLTYASGLTSTNYSFNPASSAVAYTVLQAPLNISGSKTYNGDGNLNYANMVVTGAVNGETVTLTGGTAVTSSANVAGYANTAISNPAISVTGGNHLASNYSLPAAGTMTITAVNLSITGSKIYDATTSFALNNLTVSGAVNGETVSLTSGSANSLAADAATYNNTNLTGLAIAVTGGGALSSNYHLPSQGSMVINPLAVTLSGSKTYDGLSTVNASALSVTNLPLHGASVNLTGSVSLASRNASVSAVAISSTSGLSLSNADYTLIGSSGSVTINPVSLSLTGLKTYNANTAFGAGNFSVNGVVAGEVLQLTAASANSTSADVGTYNAMPLSGVTFSVSGSNNLNSNYQLPSNVNLQVTPLPVVVSGSKTYDGTKTVAGSALTVNNVPAGGVAVTISGTGVNALSSPNASSSAIALSNFGNYALSSNDYTFTGASGSVSVNPQTLTVSGTRTYNGTQTVTNANLTASGAVNAEQISITAGTTQTPSANIGSYANLALTGLSISVTGGNANASNYSLPNSGNVTINPAPISISTSNVTKTYDGTLSANGVAVVSSGSLFANASNNSLQDTLSGGHFAFTNANSGSGNKTVNVSAVTINDGNSGNNYTVSYVNNTTSTINKAPLGVSLSATYSGTTSVVPTSFVLTGLQNGESVTSLSAATLSQSNVSNNLTNYVVSLSVGSGSIANLNNYSITQVQNSSAASTSTNSVTINPAPLGINAAGVYTGSTTIVPSTTPTLTGLLQGQTMSIASVVANDPNVLGATYITALNLNGSSTASMSNYYLNSTQNTNANTTSTNRLTINPANLTLSGSMVYTSNTSVAGSALVANGVSGQSFTVTGVGAAGNVASANVTASPIALSTLTGLSLGPSSNSALASNYNSLSVAGSQLSITPAPLGIIASGNYSGSTTISSALQLSFTGLLGGQTLSVASVNVANANVANNASNYVTGITLNPTGSTALLSNYRLSLFYNANPLSTSANAVTIQPLPLTVTALANNKVYDTSTNATATLSVSGVLAGQTVNLTSSSANFVTKNVGNSLGVTITGVSINSTSNNTQASNYVLNSSTVSTTANITPATLTLNAQSNSKVYDGNTSASTVPVVLGLLGNDTAVASEAYNSKNVVGATTLTPQVSINDGNSGHNYSVVVHTANGNITPAPLQIKAIDDAKFVTQTDAIGFNGVSYLGFVSGETSANLNGALSVTRSNASVQAAGSYSGVLVPSGLSSSNYTISYLAGNYTIVPAGELLIRANAANLTYGQAISLSPLSVQYLQSSNGTVINSLTQSTHSGNAYTYSDGAGGSVSFTLSPSPQGLGSTSTGGYYNVGNYSIVGSSLTTTGNNFNNAPVFVGALSIAQKSLSVSASPIKTYDGTVSMPVTGLGLTGVLGADQVNVLGTGIYNSSNAGSSLSYSINSLTLQGSDQANYYLSNGSVFNGTNGMISPKVITLTAPAVSKTYDASASYVPTTTDLSALTAQLGIANDVVTSATMTFQNQNAGVNKTINLNAVSVDDGNSGRNYSIAFSPNASSVISAATLTVNNSTAASKTYDGTNTANVSAGVLSGVMVGDTVNLNQSGYFVNVNANPSTEVVATDTISGVSAGNYRLIQPTGLTAAINPKLLSVSGTLVNNKVYDANVSASVASLGTLSGLVGSETLNLSAQASFNDASAGNAKAVNINYSLANGLNGGMAKNYWLNPVSVNANISPAPLLITANDAAKFVTQADVAGFNGVSYTGLVGGENALVVSQGSIGSSGSCSVPNCSNLSAGQYALTPSGYSSSNYAITYAPGIYTVVPAGQLLVRVPNASLNYGSVTNFLPSSVQYATSAGAVINSLNLVSVNASKNAFTYSDGSGGTLSFTLSASPLGQGGTAPTSSSGNLLKGNYALVSSAITQSGLPNLTSSSPVVVGDLSISAAALQLSSNPSKTYDGSKTVTSPINLTGVVTGDQVSINGSGQYASANAGNLLSYAFEQVSLSGADASNYYLPTGVNFSGSNGIIMPKPVTLTAPSQTKVYDGNTNQIPSATDLSSLSNSLGVGGDVVSAATFTYDTKNAGQNKTLTPSAAVILDGNNGQNYAVTYVSGSANAISPASLSLSALPNTKIYDGSTLALAVPLVNGLQSGDTLQVNETYVSSGVQGTNGSTLVPNVVALNDGNNGANYNLSSQNAVGSINAKPVSISQSAPIKVYDANAAINSVAATLSGVVGSDVVSATASGSFASANAGAGLSYALNSLVLAGAGAVNYVAQAGVIYTNSNGIINPAPITLSATKTYDGTTALSTANLSATGVAGQTLQLTAGTAQTNNANVNLANQLSAISGLAIANGSGLAANYTLNSPATGSVRITPAALTITATDATKNYDGNTSMTGASTVPSLVVTGTLYNNASNGNVKDAISGGVIAFLDPSPGDKNKSTVVSGVVVNDGNAGANYSVSYVRNTTSTIVAPPPAPTLTSAQLSTMSSAQIASLTPDQLQNLSGAQIASLTPSQLNGLSSYQINALSPSQLQSLSTGQISALTPSQVSGLTPIQITTLSNAQLTSITNANVSALNATQISALSAAQIQVFTPAQISALTSNQVVVMNAQQLQALTSSQVSALQAPSVAALSAGQVATFSASQVLSLSPSQLSVMSSQQLGAIAAPVFLSLSPTQIGSLSNRVVSGLSTSLVAGLSLSQIQGLNQGQLAAFTPLQVNALSSSQLGAISGSQFSALSPNALAAMSQSQLSQLNATQLQAMTASQMSGLSAQQLTGLSSLQVASLNPATLTGLNTSQVTSLTSSFMQALNSSQVSAFLPAQVASFSVSQLSALNSNQISALNGSQVVAMSSNQLASLQVSQIAALNASALSALTPSQIGALNNSQVQSLSASQVPSLAPATLSAMSLGQLSSMSNAQLQSFVSPQINALSAIQIAVLSPAAISLWSSAQIGSINVNELNGLTKSQIEALNANQISGLSSNQLAAMSVAQLAQFNSSQISVLSSTQLSSLTPSQLAVLSVPPPPVQTQPSGTGSMSSSSGVDANGVSASTSGSTGTGTGSGTGTGNSNSSSSSVTSSNAGVVGIKDMSNTTGMASQMLNNAVMAQSNQVPQALSTQPNVISNSNLMGSSLVSPNPNLSGEVQVAAPPVFSSEPISLQAQGPPIAPLPQSPAAPNPASTIVANVLKIPTSSNTGLIAVVLPKGLITEGSSISIPVPEQALIANQEVKVSLPSNESLPSWIAYNPQSQAFEARSVPAGGLPLTVVLDCAGQRTLILLSESR